MYGVVPYFLAKLVIELPISLIAPALTLVIVFWSIGFNDSGKGTAEEFGQFYIVLALLNQVAIGLSYTISSSFERADSALVASNLITLPAMLFGGMFSNSGTLPVYLKWIQYINPIYYSFSCLCHAQWENTP